MDKLTKKGLDGTQLKTIALVLMVLDHIHYFFEFTGCIPTVFSMLGRLSAPLFLFCTVEGFAHTHDRKRYFIRIWAIGAAMGRLPIFTSRFQLTIFGTSELNFCVRNGNRWNLTVIDTDRFDWFSIP